MTFPPIPSGSHGVGDTGHTADHDAIVAVLNAFLASIQGLLTATQNLWHTTGGNAGTITDAVTVFEKITLPGGNRDTAADTIDVFYGTAKVFSLNGYGELRIFPGAASHVPAIIQGLPSQTGDLLQFRDSAGNVIARAGADGSLLATGLYAHKGGAASAGAEPWNPLTLLHGWTASGNGPLPQCRLLASPPKSVELIGDLQSGTLADNTAVLNLPSGYRPNTQQFLGPLVIAGTNVYPNPRLLITPGGDAQIIGISSGVNVRIAFHGVISLDA